ncbi:MAG TPA: ankyrin repeat domain-containing protein [Chloroflexota bacterium]|nr:ankyrin repeat domain-containing protein [Chloroflexota bacterium]
MTTEVERPPALDKTLVQEFVATAHGDLPRVRELLAQEPQLVNAANDWGGGDWETGLGGAAHMGRRDIALFLLENGARLDLFAAAMLGYLDIVKSILSTHPEMRNALGPHTIPLEIHAKAGGPEAAAVLDYLRTLSA